MTKIKHPKCISLRGIAHAQNYNKTLNTHKTIRNNEALPMQPSLVTKDFILDMPCLNFNSHETKRIEFDVSNEGIVMSFST
jgi:hypothetical protein